jgi:hypothetical protein
MQVQEANIPQGYVIPPNLVPQALAPRDPMPAKPITRRNRLQTAIS